LSADMGCIKAILTRGGALMLALLINLAIFWGAPLLIHSGGGAVRGGEEMLTAYIPLKPPPPPEEEEEPPPPRKQPPKLESKPIRQLKQPKEQVHLETPQLEFEINPSLDLGVTVPAPPPMPKLKTPAAPLGQGDRGALLISRLPPFYPYSARRRGKEGSVEVRFVVDERGNVLNPEIVRAKPSGYFEEAVLKAVSRWRFKPAIKGGKPVQARVQTVIDFKLEK
jgi:protein TonB